MSGLHEAFDEIVADVPVYGDLDRAIEQAKQERRRRLGLVAGLSAAAAVLVLIAGALVVTGDDEADSPSPIGPSPTPTESTSAPAEWTGPVRDGVTLSVVDDEQFGSSEKSLARLDRPPGLRRRNDRHQRPRRLGIPPPGGFGPGSPDGARGRDHRVRPGPGHRSRPRGGLPARVKQRRARRRVPRTPEEPGHRQVRRTGRRSLRLPVRVRLPGCLRPTPAPGGTPIALRRFSRRMAAAVRRARRSAPGGTRTQPSPRTGV